MLKPNFEEADGLGISKICVKQRVGIVIPLDFQVCRDDYQCPML